MKINISIDDLSPHPRSSMGVLRQCEMVLKKHPSIKFTLFVPMAYQRIGEKAWKIWEHGGFCSALKNLPKENYELGWHGYYHGIPGISNNHEFRDIDYDAAMQKFKDMFAASERAGLGGCFRPVFRPPAWYISPDGMRAAADSGMKVITMATRKKYRKVYGDSCKYARRVIFYNVNPPQDPLKLYAETSACYHACEWDQSYFSVEMANELIAFLEKNKEYIKPCFMGEM